MGEVIEQHNNGRLVAAQVEHEVGPRRRFVVQERHTRERSSGASVGVESSARLERAVTDEGGVVQHHIAVITEDSAAGVLGGVVGHGAVAHGERTAAVADGAAAVCHAAKEVEPMQLEHRPLAGASVGGVERLAPRRTR